MDEQRQNIFSTLLTKARNADSNAPLLAVFDIDSTLFDLSPRHTAILEDFSKSWTHRLRHPFFTQRIRGFSAHSSDWGYLEGLEKMGVVPNARQHAQLHNYWQDGFFSDRYLRNDRPYEGAAIYLDQLYHNAGAHLIYLTGRHEKKMYDGTVESLRDNGFPIDKTNISLQLKNEPRVPDEDFKLQYLLNLPKDEFAEIWLIENEPVNINVVKKQAPHINIIFFDSVHSGREEVLPGVHRVDRFPTF